ncbi:MAG: conjugal transfer protein TrbL family protein [Lawsonibacter sp.]
MSSIFSSLLSDIINSAISDFDGVMLWILDGMLHVENMTDSAASTIVTSHNISEVYQFIYFVAGALLILKFLFKGIEIYLLWRDGDPENSPQDMLMGGIEGTVMMLVFPYLYDVMAEVTVFFATGIMDRFGLSTGDTIPISVLDPVGIAEKSILLLILLIVYLVLMVVMMIKLVGRGFELLILRLGVPIACMGLVDSDKGLFKGYIQIVFKTLFTSVIQIVMLSFSLRMIVTLNLFNLICAVSIISIAMGAPLLMQQILVATGRGGGGMIQKLYSAGMMANTIRRMIGK